MENYRLKISTIFLLLLACLCTFSQEIHLYRCEYDVTPEGEVIIKAVYNDDKEHSVKVIVDNNEYGTIARGGSLPLHDIICSKKVMVYVNGINQTVDIIKAKEILDNRKDIRKTNPTIQDEEEKSSEKPIQDEVKTNNSNIPLESQTSNQSVTIESDEVINAFANYLDTLSYYSKENFNSIKSEVDSYIDAMKYMDQGQKRNYISEKQLNGYVTDAKQDIKKHSEELDLLIDDFLGRYLGTTINDKQRCLDEMQKIVSSKLEERRNVITRLEDALGKDDSANSLIDKILSNKSLLVIVGGGILAILVIFIVIAKIKRKKAAKEPTLIPSDSTHQSTSADIVVRRKTTSILKKQSLEDVQNNPAYLKIDCADFCEDSAVRRLYIKNTCIKDIYNMYAEDLRNPENPNEDGCMVLGRWVHDTETDEYYVSLEEIVKPGDDAVFQEYELNFGGKIKLKVSEKLRKLRRETNLQYDMTCWVHSHPGLGVFFSNADSGVQMQLKHPSHPKFLTAIVIDILTPNQELGIFTFKHDMSINSRQDLKKMYSLEEMYKWAISSDRNSFKAEDYYNLMLTSKERTDSCYGVQLSNGAIIDMCQMEAEQQSGLVGWVQGYNCKKDSRNEFVAKSVSKEKVIPDNDLLGCFMIGSHRSLPTIRKAITNADKIQFVLFYSTSDKMLSAIPVVDGQLSVEENYYGEEKLEELKIWTRRKR